MLKKDLEALGTGFDGKLPLRKCTAVVRTVSLFIDKLVFYSPSLPLKLGVLL